MRALLSRVPARGVGRQGGRGGARRGDDRSPGRGVSASAAPALSTLLLIGCGKMGGALLGGWLERGIAQRYLVVEPGPGAEPFRMRRGVDVVRSAADLDLGL